MHKKKKLRKIYAFDLPPGALLANKYVVVEKLGSGWEGEVYLVREKAAKIERTAKLFFPQRNIRDKVSNFYAKKLHKLRHCPIVIQYHTQDTFDYQEIPIRFLVSEFVQGEKLSSFLAHQRGKRLHPFEALHLLHTLTHGIECIHKMGDYHGDLHSDNIIVQHYGLGFQLKLIDMFHWGPPTAENRTEDLLDLIRTFHEVLGGPKHYAKLPAEIKSICCGLKRTLILKKFKTVAKLRSYLENLQWQ